MQGLKTTILGRTRVRRSCAMALGLATMSSAFAGTAVSAATPASVAVTSLNGAAPTRINKVKGSGFTVTGTATGLPALDADAGPSQYLKQGSTRTLYGNAFNAVAPASYAWTLDGSAAPFAGATTLRPTLDTTGLTDGVHDAALKVTDSRGLTVTRHSKMVTYRVLGQTLAERSGQLSPSPALLTGTPVGDVPPSAPVRVPFTVPAGTDSIDLTLDYDQLQDPAGLGFAAGSMSVTVEDPSGAQNNNQDGSKGAAANPEKMHIDRPAAGQWYADVTDFLSAPNANYHLLVSSTLTTVANPLPHMAAGGPYSFALGTPQQLQATASGGRAPLAVSWDLTQEGHFATLGAAPVTSFGLGSHLVTARVVDAAGFDTRDTTAVRVVSPGSGSASSPMVVVALADTGINPYHQDFGAALYPDKSILSRSNNFTADPATYIPGYPVGTPSLNVHLGTYDPPSDQPLWDVNGATQLNTLYWIPGTKIVGAMDSGLSIGAPEPGAPTPAPARILDTAGHGTASASVMAGNVNGTCPQCLLVAIKGLGGETWAYTQSWIDIVSNSYGALANVGEAGTGLLGGPTFPQASAERGQLGLYAAGNGNENAFVTPEQTYTSNELGPDWVIRIGAVDRSDNQPFIGTGKPVSASSYGLGNIPAAGHDSTNGQVQHNGTSAATPQSAGVFATTLAAVRGALGDSGVGQRANAVIATGTAVAGSPYLADGKLTRSELVEAVLKTAETGTENTSLQFPPTVPGNPFQFAIEGYGILNVNTGRLAQNVLMGNAALPARVNEDQFMSLDGDLRDALWGTWSGGGVNSANPNPEPDAATNPFKGVRAAQVASFPSALKLLQAASPQGAAAQASPSQPTVTLDNPTNGLTLDPGSTSLPVAGKAAFPASAYTGAANTFYLRRDACGASQTGSQVPYLARQPQPAPAQADGCGSLADPLAPGFSALGAPVADDYAMTTSDLPAVLAGNLPVAGTVYLNSTSPSPVTTIDVALVSGGTVINDQVVTGAILLSTVPFNFSFAVPEQYVGVALDDLHLVVSVQAAESALGTSIVNPASFVRLPLAPSVVPAGGAVQLSLDDPSFGKPVAVSLGPGLAFQAGLSIAGIAPAPSTHTLFARALSAAATGPAVSAMFQVATAVTGPPPVLPGTVQLQLVALGKQATPTAWINATDLAGDGTFATWTAQVSLAGLKRGNYTLLTRIIRTDGSTVSGPAQPIRFVW
ncbi:MAG: hypothetical protein QOK05_1966 [Chloroflexota bacterium]|jgi:hypothetical protein|nr:hypothetical protein [Chloroflexota bacterium]